MDWFFSLFLAIFLFAIATFTKKSVLRLGVLPQLHGQGTGFHRHSVDVGQRVADSCRQIMDNLATLKSCPWVCPETQMWSSRDPGNLSGLQAYIPSSSKTPSKNFFVLCTFSVPEDLRWGQCQLSQALLRSSGRFAPKALGEGFGMIWELWGFSRSTTYGWTDLPTHCKLDDETQQIKHPGRSRFTNGKEPC